MLFFKNTFSKQPTRDTLSQFDGYRLNIEIKVHCWIHRYNHRSSHTLDLKYGSVTQAPRLDKWRRDKELGRGGFGTVWLEREEKGALRAVKKLSRTKWNKSELHAMMRLNKYPQYFVQFLGWFEHGKYIYFALEYIEHGDLGAYIEERSVAEADAIVITTQLLEGLKIIHENSLSPGSETAGCATLTELCLGTKAKIIQNILVASLSPLSVKITDFGISKQTTDDTALRTGVGTPAYMAPEIFDCLTSETSEYTTAVDIWSLGCLVHTILTKEVPFLATSELLKYIRAQIPFPETKLVENKASNSATKFIVGLMAPDPEIRFTAETALEDPWLKPNRLLSSSDTTHWETLTIEWDKLKVENTKLKTLNVDQSAEIKELKLKLTRLGNSIVKQDVEIKQLRKDNKSLGTQLTNLKADNSNLRSLNSK